MQRKLSLTIWDALGIPFRLLFFKQEWLQAFGWTTLEEDRIRAVLPHISGRLLDVGAGKNNLVRRFGVGIGVDVIDWGGGVQVVKNTAQLPFADASFDTITFVASLNHIPYRQECLREARRLIRPDGRLILTMINPIFGAIGHALWWYSEDKQRGGMANGEVGGLWSRDVIRLCEDANFRLLFHRRFLYWMNHLYVFKPIPKGKQQGKDIGAEAGGDTPNRER